MPAKQLSAEEFVLYDAQGRMRAVLNTWGDCQPHLQMFDEEGLPRISIGIDKGGHPQINILAADGNLLVGLGRRGDGAIGIGVSDANGMPAINASVTPDGKRELLVVDQDGQTVFMHRF